jgi:flagellar motor protein MotB
MNRMTSGLGRGVMAAMILCGLLLGGCTNKLKTENEALWKQNKELEDELKSNREALEAANNDRAKLQQMLSEKETAPAPGAGGKTKGSKGGEIGDEFGPGTKVTHGPGGTTIGVAGEVLFDSGSATLKATAKTTLKKIAAALNRDASQPIRVEGHSDSDPIHRSKWKDNAALSEARATSVRDYLAQQGVSRGRMTTHGFGDAKPVASNSTKTGKAQNRRVEIVIQSQ